jgi:hypothetical protein
MTFLQQSVPVLLVMLRTSMLYKGVVTANKAAVISQNWESQIGYWLQIQAL